jgi:ADP-ribose pyrophosphatase YjhB (NUDIX family)
MKGNKMDDEVRFRAFLAVVNQHRIMLVPGVKKETDKPCWSLPGGGVKSGEQVSHAAVRCFEEETGYKVEITGILEVDENILPTKPYHHLTVTFLGRLTNPAADEKNSKNPHNVGWFSEQELEDITTNPQEPILKALQISVL